MTLNKTGMRTGTAVVAVALLAAACGGSSSTNNDKPKAQGTKGGALSVLMISDFEHLDPQRNYVSSALNFGRLLYRQLTTYKSEAGTAGTELAPDLATDLGKATDNAKTWTFTLKDGLKYEDGTEIKASDIKYGVERSMSPLIPDGPQYAKQYLEGGKDYKGPFDGKELASIIADDAKKTITFKLAQPHGDFGYTVSLPTFAPVPKAKDTKVNYDNHVVSSGPYKIDTYARGKSLTLSRNINWGSDTVRKALPATIKATFGLDANVIDQRLLASAGEDATAVTIDTSVQPANVVKVQNDPAVKARSIQGTTGFLRYIALNTQKGVTKNLKVRQAIEYAVNKTDQQTARGGANAAGDLATTILAPTVGGHKDFNIYDGGATGDPTKAKQLLSEAGYPNGLSLDINVNNSPKGVAQATALQASLAKAGIKGTIKQIDAAVYYTTIGDIAKEPEIVFAAWGPDWPSAGTVIPPLLDGRQIVPQGNQNFSQLNVPEINSEIDRIQAITDQSKAATEWGNLDEKIMKDYAPFVPLLNDKAIYLLGKDVKGAFLHAFYGEPDLSAIGVA